MGRWVTLDARPWRPGIGSGSRFETTHVRICTIVGVEHSGYRTQRDEFPGERRPISYVHCIGDRTYHAVGEAHEICAEIERAEALPARGSEWGLDAMVFGDEALSASELELPVRELMLRSRTR